MILKDERDMPGDAFQARSAVLRSEPIFVVSPLRAAAAIARKEK